MLEKNLEMLRTHFLKFCVIKQPLKHLDIPRRVTKDSLGESARDLVLTKCTLTERRRSRKQV